MSPFARDGFHWNDAVAAVTLEGANDRGAPREEIIMTTQRILIGAVSLFLFSGNLRADEAENRAVKLVEKLGGMFERDDKVDGKPITFVDLHDTEVTDAELKELTGLKQLQRLVLRHTPVTDAGLKHLAA